MDINDGVKGRQKYCAMMLRLAQAEISSRNYDQFGFCKLQTATFEERTTGGQSVEGPNDAIRLSLLGVPAVAICSNRITEEQANKLAT